MFFIETLFLFPMIEMLENSLIVILLLGFSSFFFFHFLFYRSRHFPSFHWYNCSRIHWLWFFQVLGVFYFFIYFYFFIMTLSLVPMIELLENLLMVILLLGFRSSLLIVFYRDTFPLSNDRNAWEFIDRDFATGF